MRTTALIAAALLQSACASIVALQAGHWTHEETATAPSQGSLSCAGKPCAAAPVDAITKHTSWPILAAGVLAEGGCAAGASIKAFQADTAPAWTSAAVVCGALFALDAAVIYLQARSPEGFTDRTFRFKQPVELEFQGFRRPLIEDDVRDPANAGRPLPVFDAPHAAALAAERGRREAASGPPHRVAVIDPRHGDGLKDEDSRWLGDLVRSHLARERPAWSLIPPEDLLLLLQAAGGATAQDCDATCQMQAARASGADRILTGDLSRVDGQLRLALRLDDATEGRLISVATASAANLTELEGRILPALGELLRPAP